MDPSRFQRHVDSLREANVTGAVPSITAALEDLSKATYRDYTIKSYLVEAGVVPILVDTSTILPHDSTTREAHSAVALCLWGLMIGHRPNKIKLVEQGGLTVLIKGLSVEAHEDCAQYSALAVWSLCYSVPENQLSAADSIPALKTLLDHPSGLVQYAAAGALWAVSSHPTNREQLVLDKQLLLTLVRFLPKTPSPSEEPPLAEPSAILPIPDLPSSQQHPMQNNRVTSQPVATDEAGGYLSLEEVGERSRESSPDEVIHTSETAVRSWEETISPPNEDTGVSQTGSLLETDCNARSSPSTEDDRPPVEPLEPLNLAGLATPSDPNVHGRDSSTEASTQTSPVSQETRTSPSEEPPEGAPVESRHESAYREIRESWLEATGRLSENLQRQTDFLGRRTRRLRGLSGTAPSPSVAAAAVSGANELSAAIASAGSLESGTGVSLPSLPLQRAPHSGALLAGEAVRAPDDVTPLDFAEAPVASGLGSESAEVWSPRSENAVSVVRPSSAPHSSSAIEELRSLVRAERARAEAFVARARSLVDEERAIRGNIGALERELAIAVRERDAAVRERDRTSAVLGRALAALSSARDQLAALGGTLRAANSAGDPPVAPVPSAGTGQPEEFELLDMLETPPGQPTPDPQQERKACLMVCLLLGNLSLCRRGSGTEEGTVFEGERWAEAMAGVLRFVTGLGGLDAFWATMLWTTVQPLVDLLQSTEPAVQALSLFIVVDLCTGNEHKHKFIMEGAVPHLGSLCTSPSPLVRRLARNALLQLGMRPSAFASAEAPSTPDSGAGGGSAGSDDVSECVICCDEVSAAAFEPCGHVVSCLRCAQCLVARGDRCPLCREAIGSVNVRKGVVGSRV